MAHSWQSKTRMSTLVALLLDLEAFGQVLLVLPQALAASRLLVHVVALVVELILTWSMRSTSYFRIHIQCNTCLAVVHLGEDGFGEKLVLGKLELELAAWCVDGESLYADIMMSIKTRESLRKDMG